MDKLTALARDFKALGHPARLAILFALRGGEQCVCHLERALGMRQAYISQQLGVLKEAGIVQDRRDGWNMFYRVIRPDIYTVIAKAGGPAFRPGSASSLPRRAHSLPADCPCPKCSPENETPHRPSAHPAAAKSAPKAAA